MGNGSDSLSFADLPHSATPQPRPTGGRPNGGYYSAGPSNSTDGTVCPQVLGEGFWAIREPLGHILDPAT